MNNIQFVPILAVSRQIAPSSPAANLNSAKLTLLSRLGFTGMSEFPAFEVSGLMRSFEAPVRNAQCTLYHCKFKNITRHEDIQFFGGR